MTSSEPIVRIEGACAAGARLLPQFVARLDQLEAMVAELMNAFSSVKIELASMKERVERLETDRVVPESEIMTAEVYERIRDLCQKADQILALPPASRRLSS